MEEQRDWNFTLHFVAERAGFVLIENNVLGIELLILRTFLPAYFLRRRRSCTRERPSPGGGLHYRLSQQLEPTTAPMREHERVGRRSCAAQSSSEKPQASGRGVSSGGSLVQGGGEAFDQSHCVRIPKRWRGWGLS